MTNYARMYRSGSRPGSAMQRRRRQVSPRCWIARRPSGPAPWAVRSTSAAAAASTPPELARRGWEAVGIDYVPAAVEAAKAKSRGTDGLSYVVGDVTRLESARLGTFDFFLDIGCFQGLDAGQRQAQAEGVSALANPGATMLLLSFGPSRWRWLVEGASQEEVQTAFAGWQMLAAKPADTAGLGWPMNQTAPRWYRLRRQT